MEITLKDLLAEIRNLSYLFYGYSAIWIILLGYLFMLTRREKSLRDEIAELKQLIESEKSVNSQQ
ncbi:MAG: CcmD family protein [Chloroflexi bacterium]|nr:CcmD family protein [Chloroflexota bacterium]